MDSNFWNQLLIPYSLELNLFGNRLPGQPYGMSCGCKRVWEFLFPLQVYNRELEYEYGTFEDWLHTFNLYRGKCSDDADVEQNAADEDRLIGKFKVCHQSLPNCNLSSCFWLANSPWTFGHIYLCFIIITIIIIKVPLLCYVKDS